MRVQGIVIASVAAGFVGGYAFAKNKLIKEFNEKLEFELKRTRDFYDVRYGVGDNLDAKKVMQHFEESELVEEHVKEAEVSVIQSTSEIASDAARAMTNYQQGPMALVEQATEAEPEPNDESDEGDASEPEPLDPENPYIAGPYVIDSETFLANEADYSQSTLTYYAGDMTLTDEKDEVLDTDWTFKHIRFDNLNRFGEKSGDPNVVYIRCEQYKMDFELCRSSGKYSIEVAGLES